MKLIDYLDAQDLNMAEFGRLIGRSDATVSRIARGLNPPDWRTMKAIRAVTRGAVMPNDFLPERTARRASA